MRLGDIVIIVSCVEVPSSRYHASAAGFTPTVPGARCGRGRSAGQTRRSGTATGRSTSTGAAGAGGRGCARWASLRHRRTKFRVYTGKNIRSHDASACNAIYRIPQRSSVYQLATVTPLYEATPLIYGADPRRGRAIRVSCVVLLHTVHTLQCSCCASMTPLHPRFKAGQS